MARIAKNRIKILREFARNNNFMSRESIEKLGIKNMSCYLAKLRYDGFRIKSINRGVSGAEYMLETPHKEIDFKSGHMKGRCVCGSGKIHAKGMCRTCYYKGRKQSKAERELQKIAAKAVRNIKPNYEPIQLQHLTGQRFEQAFDQIIDGMHR